MNINIKLENSHNTIPSVSRKCMHVKAVMLHPHKTEYITGAVTISTIFSCIFKDK